MFFSLFLLGGLGFWILFAVLSIAIITLIEYEKPGLATLTLVLFAAALGVCGDFNVLRAVRDNPLTALAMLVSYLLAGAVWAVVKWWFHVRAKRESYEDDKRSWMSGQYRKILNPKYVEPNVYSTNRGETNRFNQERYEVAETGVVSIPEELKVSFADYARDYLIPSVKRSKSLIMSWMCYWPWSMLWTMINDPVRRMFKAMYLHLKEVFVGIRNRAYGDIASDLPIDYKLGE